MSWIQNERARVESMGNPALRTIDLPAGYTVRGRLTPRLRRRGDRVLWFPYGAFCVLLGVVVAAAVVAIWLT